MMPALVSVAALAADAAGQLALDPRRPIRACRGRQEPDRLVAVVRSARTSAAPSRRTVGTIERVLPRLAAHTIGSEQPTHGLSSITNPHPHLRRLDAARTPMRAGGDDAHRQLKLARRAGRSTSIDASKSSALDAASSRAGRARDTVTVRRRHLRRGRRALRDLHRNRRRPPTRPARATTLTVDARASAASRSRTDGSATPTVTVSVTGADAPATDTGSVIASVRLPSALAGTDDLDRRRIGRHRADDEAGRRLALDAGHDRHDLASPTARTSIDDVRRRDLHDLDAERRAHVGAGQVKQPPSRRAPTAGRAPRPARRDDAAQRARRSAHAHVDDVRRLADELELRAAGW